MPLHVRDERALQLARKLAERRGTTLTAAVIVALENELQREATRPPLAERARLLATALAGKSKSGERRTVTKAEIDDMWGND